MINVITFKIYYVIWCRNWNSGESKENKIQKIIQCVLFWEWRENWKEKQRNSLLIIFSFLALVRSMETLTLFLFHYMRKVSCLWLISFYNKRQPWRTPHLRLVRGGSVRNVLSNSNSALVGAKKPLIIH